MLEKNKKIIDVLTEFKKESNKNFDKVLFDGTYLIFSMHNSLTPPICLSVKDNLLYDYLQIIKKVEKEKFVDLTIMYNDI